MLPGPLLNPQLANTSSIKRLGQSHKESLEQNLNDNLRYSFQRRDSNLFKSQSSIKNRQSQALHALTQVPSHPNHPISRYQGRSGIDSSSKIPFCGSPMYQYHKEKSLYCPSEHHSRSSAHETAEMMPKQIGVSPKDQINLTPSRVRLDRMSSRFKFQNQCMGPKKDCSSDRITCSSELNSRMLDQRRMGKFDNRTSHHKKLPEIVRKKKSGDYIPVDTSSKSNSVSSSLTSSSSSSSSKGGLGSLPVVPFQKPGHLPVVPLQKSSHLLVPACSRKPSTSQHDHNKSPQKILSTHHHKFVSSRKNSKKLLSKEEKKGRFRQLKDKLAIVFHHRHDHHHYHHHHTSEDGSTNGRAGWAAWANKDHHHRSFWKYLKGIVHHSSEQMADQIVPSQHHHHRHMRALFRMLFGHLWGNKQRKKARLGRTASRVHVKKLRWWHKFGRGGPMKLTTGKKARLMLRYGAKGGSMKKGYKR